LNPSPHEEKKTSTGNKELSMSDYFRGKSEPKAEIVSSHLLRFFSQKITLKEYLDAVIDELGKWTDCRCIGVRILDAEGYIPYESCKGFSPQFLERENRLSIKSDQCVCIRVIRGEFSIPDKSEMTRHGSFHCLNSERFVAGLASDQRSFFRGTCVESRFKTICIIPIRYRDSILGAIHLADEREGLIHHESIEAIESISLLIGEAVFRYGLEENLESSEKRYRSLIENSLWGIYLVQDRKITYANQAFAAIHGYEVNELVGLDSLQIVHPENRYLIEDIRRKRLRGEETPTKYELRGLKKNGDIIWIQRRNVRMEYNGKPAVLGYEIDITEQKKNETSLQESHELLETIFSNVHFLVAYMDRDFNFIRVNRAYAEADNKSPDFFVGKNHFVLYPNAENEAIFRKVIETGQPFFVYGKPFEYTPDPGRGTTYWDWSLQPVKDSAGSISGIVLSLVNITDRKRAEEALKRANEDLVQRTADLERSNRDLREFAFVASHDLQEPLRKIQTFGQMLVDRCGQSLDEVSRDYLRRMRMGAERMRDLLNSLLTYSRITSKAETKRKTDLTEAVQTALSNLEIPIKEKNARFEVDDLPTVNADRTQMIQLFQNLIGNAIKYQRDGTRPHIKIYTRTENDNGNLVICVEDNGIGLEKDTLNKIFVPFQRLHGRSAYEGAGMGLAICRKIAERHGGTITVSSELGKGSTFMVTMPSS
jgi:PAS domain S-box-containing protein